MTRHPYLVVAKGVVGLGGILAALAMAWAILFGVGLAAVDSGHTEYRWWLVPLSAIPLGYAVVVVLALLDRVWAAFVVAIVAWLIALGAWGWLPGQLANEYASHSLPVVLVAATTAFALAATYMANALRGDGTTRSGGTPAGPSWGRDG